MAISCETMKMMDDYSGKEGYLEALIDIRVAVDGSDDRKINRKTVIKMLDLMIGHLKPELEKMFTEIRKRIEQEGGEE